MREKGLLSTREERPLLGGDGVESEEDGDGELFTGFGLRSGRGSGLGQGEPQQASPWVQGEGWGTERAPTTTAQI